MEASDSLEPHISQRDRFSLFHLLIRNLDNLCSFRFNSILHVFKPKGWLIDEQFYCSGSLVGIYGTPDSDRPYTDGLVELT